MAQTRPRVLLTGAAGAVGSALRRGWEAADRYELTLTDVRPIEDAQSPSEIGDIRDAEMTRRLCAGQDALVHLSYLGADNAAEDAVELTDIGLSMRLFRQAAEAGLAPAQLNLGVLYAQGEGVERNLVEAWVWFDLAASKDQAQADVFRSLSLIHI